MSIFSSGVPSTSPKADVSNKSRLDIVGESEDGDNLTAREFTVDDAFASQIATQHQQGGNHLTHGWIKNLQKVTGSIESLYEEINGAGQDEGDEEAVGCSVVIGSIGHGDGASSICDNLVWMLGQNMPEQTIMLLRIVEMPQPDDLNLDLSRPSVFDDISQMVPESNMVKINLISSYDPRISIGTARNINQLVRALKPSVDVLVIDVPGFEVNSLGYLIARRASTAMIVAREDRYEEADVEHVIDELHKSEIDFSGFILNFVEPR
ncbi:MAG: hypothetical protein ACJATK_000112 [Paracoccaceae bacterium]|jgi:hypothetical protein